MRRVWNANTHYHNVVLGALPPNASRVLDVGCGDGVLAADLAGAGVPIVVGLDIDRHVLKRACTRHRDQRIHWVRGDAHDAPFRRGSFDAVVSVAALHHMDAARALTRFTELVRPGGSVVVVGLASNARQDLPLAALAAVSKAALTLVHGYWNHSAPECWPPPLTFRQMKALTTRVLPGARYRRHLLGRYSIVWRRPA